MVFLRRVIRTESFARAANWLVACARLAVPASLLLPAALASQTVYGTAGLVSVPTAEMPPDATLSVGTHVLARDHHGIRGAAYEGQAIAVHSASLAFLPFIEIGLRFSHAVDATGNGLGDRALNARARIVEEGETVPAIVVGGQDLVGTRLTHALYVVASKHVKAVPHLADVGVHLGYGGDWLSLRPGSRALRGMFGGISIAPHASVHLLLEYDTERINSGIQLRISRLRVLGAMHNLDGFSGGISYAHPLM